MPKRRSIARGSSRAHLFLGLVAVAVLGGFALAFKVYVQRNSEAVARRSFRVLAGVARQIQTRIDALDDVFEGALQTCASPASGVTFEACVRERLSDIPWLHIGDATRQEGAFAITRELPLEQPVHVTSREGQRSQLLTVRLDLSDILEDNAHTPPFGTILVADDGLEDIHATDLATLPVLNLREVLAAVLAPGVEQPARGAASPSLGSNPPASANVSRADDLAGAGTDFSSISTKAARIDLFGQQQQAFFRWLPLDRPSDRSRTRHGLLLCGLIPAAEFDDQAQAIPPVILGLLLSGIMLGICGFPIVRFFALGREERLTRWDLRLLGAGAFLGFGFLAFLLFEQIAYRQVVNRLDQEAQELANQVDTKLRKDLQASYSVLAKAQQQIQRKSWIVYRGPDLSCGEKRGGSLRMAVDASQLLYPFIVSELDEKGALVRRWRKSPDGRTLRELTSSRNRRFADRRYFVDAQAGNLVKLSAEGAGAAVEPVRSRLDGSNTVVIARPADPASPGHGGVFTIDWPILSYVPPALPRGFSFAIVDAQGNVLFHSDVHRIHAENLFEETDAGDRLLAQSDFGSARPIHANYYGEPYQLFLKPLQDLGWTVVVLRDESDLRTLTSTVAIGWLLLFFGYGLVVVTAVLLARWSGFLPPDCLEPIPDRAPGCGRAVGLMLVVSLAALPALLHVHAGGLVDWLVLVPVATLIILRLGPAHSPRASRRATAFLWLALLAITLGLLALGSLTVGLATVAVTAACLASAAMAGTIWGRRASRRANGTAAIHVALLLGLLINLSGIPSVVLLASLHGEALRAYVTLGQMTLLRSIVDQSQQMVRGEGLEGSRCERNEFRQVVLRGWQTRTTQSGPKVGLRPSAYAQHFPTAFFYNDDATRLVEKDPEVMQGGTPRQFNLAAFTDAKVMSSIPVYNRDSSVLAEIWRQRFEDEQGSLTSFLAKLPHPSGEVILSRAAFGAARDPSPGRAAPAGSPSSASVARAEPGGIEQIHCSENGLDVAGILVTDPHLKALLGHDPDEAVSFTTYLERPFLPRAGEQVVWLATWLIAGCLGASWLVRSIVRRLRTTRRASDASGPRLYIMARPGESALAASAASRLDLSALADETTDASPAWMTSRTIPTSGTVIVEGLEYLHGDPVVDERKLTALETLLAVPELAVVILSRIEPLRAFGGTPPAGNGKRPDGAGCAAGDPTSRRRWLDVMSQLVIGAVETTEDAAGGLEWLLGSAVAQVARELEVTGPGFADRDSAFLREWNGLTRPEKLVLVQLADEGLVNHRRADIVFDLVDRGILSANPTIRFRHRNLRELVLRIARVDRVREWETTTRRGAMTALEMPIALGLGLLAVFLYLTQRDLYITITSLAGAAASAVPWMTRMATTFSGTRLARAPLGSGTPMV